MSRADDLRLITRIAQMYYVEARKQSEISEVLHIPQTRISRLLKRAIDENIVRITINPPAGVFAELEAEIRALFGLDAVIVAESVSDKEDSVIAAIGDAAAHFVETTVADEEVIGMSSWSASLLRMVDAITPIKRVQASKVVQILGGIGSPAVQSHAQHLVIRMAQLTGAKAQFLPAPGVAGSAESRDILLDDPFVKEDARVLLGRDASTRRHRLHDALPACWPIPAMPSRARNSTSSRPRVPSATWGCASSMPRVRRSSRR